MISGVMPCSKWDEIGYPWRQAIPCWSRVCDEIILVVDGIPQAKSMFAHLSDLQRTNNRNGVKCNLRVHAVMNPRLEDFGSYGSYLMYGISLASNPDWMIAIEADYLISPDAAGILKKSIVEASLETELVTARVMTMNYTGTSRVYLPDFKNWFIPGDGFTWQRPIASRIGLGVYPGMYCGVDQFNYTITCEGFIRLRSGDGYGKTYHSKNWSLYGNNGFKILDTGIEFEHLTFTKNVMNILKKMEGDDGYYKKQNIGLREILDGHRKQQVIYSELEEVKRDYAKREKELRDRL